MSESALQDDTSLMEEGISQTTKGFCSGRLQEYLASLEPDKVMDQHIRDSLQRLVPLKESKGKDCREIKDRANAAVWRPLLVGYGGAGNAGADIRLIEGLRLLRLWFPKIAPTVLLQQSMPELDEFDYVTVVQQQGYFPDFLEQTVPAHDGVIIYEGSVLTSTFSDDLSLKFIAAMAMAAKLNKPAMAFGVQVDNPSRRLQQFLPALQGTQLWCRSTGSFKQASEFELEPKPGSDTAWIYRCPATQAGKSWLIQQGWQPGQDILVVCPINPFCWPVKADPLKLAAMNFDSDLQTQHHSGMNFYSNQGSVTQQLQNYLQALNECIAAFNREKDGVVVLLPMEPVDLAVCQKLRDISPVNCCIASELNTDLRVAILQQASMVITARFHASVMALIKHIPVLGIALDNRISDLFEELDISSYCVRPDDIAIREKLPKLLGELWLDRSAFAAKTQQGVVQQKQQLAAMGKDMIATVTDYYPGVATMNSGTLWQDYLPKQ